MYKLDLSAIVHSELDNWENGCIPESSSTEFFNLPLKEYYKTLPNLIESLLEHFSLPLENCILDSCEEEGRLDIQWLSRRRNSFSKPSLSTISSWKGGCFDLYYNTCSVYIVAIDDNEQEAKISLQEALGLPEYPGEGDKLCLI